MTTSTSIRNLFASHPPRTIRKASSRRRLALEALEERQLLSTFTVTNTNDSGTGSLRAEIGLANSAGGTNTIVFNTDPTQGTDFSMPRTITLAHFVGAQLELSDTTGTETITGPAAGVTVSGGGLSRVFQVDANVTASISGLTITGGRALGVSSNTDGGGGVKNYGALALTNCIISGNSATRVGGGLDDQGNTATVNLTNCTISGNSAGTAGSQYGRGGGLELRSSSAATLTNCTVSGNSVVSLSGSYSGYSGYSAGAGLRIALGVVTLDNCTVSGNFGAKYGGGVSVAAGNVSTILANCTVSGNSAFSGGGLNNHASSILGNTIVAGNTASTTGPDALGSFTSKGHNLIGEPDGSSGWVGSDLTGTVAVPRNPLLGPLSNNGGPTQTMALLPGSPAINAGSNALIPAGITTDQRGTGYLRIVNVTVDIGAFEVQNVSTTTSLAAPTVTYNSNGIITVTVASSSGTPTGTVQLSVDGGSPLSQTLSSGSTTFTLVSPNAVNHSLTATYAAQGNFLGSSASGVLNVNPAATAVTINTSAVTYNADGSANVTVSSGAGTPGGNVTLSVDGEPAQSEALSGGAAVFTIPGPGAGPHDLSAVYAAQGNYAASSAHATLNVNQASTTIAIAAPTVTYNGDGTVTLAVSSSTAPPPTGTVSLSVDGAAAQSATLDGNGMATFTLTSPSAGDHTLHAVYAIQGNYAGSSVDGTLHVDPAATSIIVSAPTVTYSSDGIVTVTVSAPAGVPTPSGTVTLTVNGGSPLSGTLAADGTATFTLPSPNAGDYTLQAAYATQDNYFGSMAGGTLTVQRADLYVTATANSKTYGATASDTGTISGVLNSDGITASFSSAGDAATAPVGTGSYLITAALSDPNNKLDNYTVIETDALLTVNKADATISVVPYSVTYDGVSHTATVTSITGVNGETGDTVGTVDVSNTTHTPAGTYASDYWFFTGGANYNNIGNTTITDVILPAGTKSSITANFNGTAMPAGSTLWFNSVLKVGGLSSSTPTTVRFVSQTISFTANGIPYTYAVPDSVITYSTAAPPSVTTFNTTANRWETTVAISGLSGNQFLAALALPLPNGLPGGIKNVTWSGDFVAPSGVKLAWKWGAAVYTSFSTDYNQLAVKPVDDTSTSQYKNSDHAGTPEGKDTTNVSYKSYVTGGATGGGGSNYTGGYSGTQSGAFQLADGSTSEFVSDMSNQIFFGVLTVAAQDDTGNGLDANELARLDEAMSYLNDALGSFGVSLSWAAAGTDADVHVHFATMTPQGGMTEGVLGFTTAANDVYLVTAWNFYTGADPTGIGTDQFDFLTLATHELAHTVGLGESIDPGSVMYQYLSPGTVRRTFTDSNLTLINTDADRFMKVAENGAVQSPAASFATATVAGGVTQMPSLVSLTPTVTASTSSTFGPAPATGSSFAVSIGSFSLPATAQSLGPISNSTSAGMTSAPLSSSSSSSWSSPAPAHHLLLWSTPAQAVSSASAVEHQAVSSEMDWRQDDADTDLIVPARRGRGPVGESVLDDLAADLLLSRGQDRDGAAPADVPALPPTGVAVAPGAAMSSMPLDQDGPSAKSAVGLVAIGLAAGLWAARGRGITAARRRQPGIRSSRGKSLDLGSGSGIEA